MNLQINTNVSEGHTAFILRAELLKNPEDLTSSSSLPRVPRISHLLFLAFRVMFAFGEVFLYRQRLHTIKKMFYVVVQYVGPVKNACKYRYEAEFRSSKGEQKVIMIGNITVGLHEDIDAICEAGNCVTMEYDVVKSMAEGNQLLYAVRVLKPGSTLE
jgi:hypothetical protein